MATTPNYLYSYFLIFLLPSTLIYGNTILVRKGVKLQLIHRFSPSLPFHRVDTFEKFLERNEKKFMHQTNIATFQQEGADVSLITPSTDHLFYVNLSIGNPPISQYLTMDITSRFIWVVEDSKKKVSNYSPEASSTHRYFSCDSSACKKLCQSRCEKNKGKNCTCPIREADGQISDVNIGSDHLVFHNAIVKNVVMGINSRPQGKFSNQDEFYGVFGLGPRYPSFTNWLSELGANKFSYYINGKVTNTIHPFATLKLGNMADVDDHNTTPLRLNGTRYQVTLESLSFGEMKLDIDPKEFAEVTTDTGSVRTYLPAMAFDNLVSTVADLLNERGFTVKSIGDDGICFYGFLEEVERSDFPVLSFNFAQGASLQLDEDDLFMEGENCSCTTVRKSSSVGHPKLTIIGLTATQDYIMGFDLDKSILSMKID